MANLKGLKKVQTVPEQPAAQTVPEQPAAQTVPEQPAAQTVPAQTTTGKVLKTLKKSTPAAEGAKQPSSTSNSSFTHEKYLELLADGKAHSISSILDHFGLPHTSAGREKIRNSNRQIGEAFIQKKSTVNVVADTADSGKAWKLVDSAQK